MSADNWTVCPKCYRDAEIAKKREVKSAQGCYGKASPKEYEERIKKARLPIAVSDTLREDYEFRMEDSGHFTAKYSARCDRCGFKHKFKHAESVKLDDVRGEKPE